MVKHHSSKLRFVFCAVCGFVESLSVGFWREGSTSNVDRAERVELIFEEDCLSLRRAVREIYWGGRIRTV